ncbi:hypothetical protein Y032_0138g2082 [Ancylostoma ceylanicum]|uniref:RNA-directed DNA polymerase n=1 Tax=Ancylostoma ceylanicum TaxID=53326 RepID=A0A016T431_9BILA|nr:hypothetical protein Y032_0138g2082 [Ancylostoma ceylanicum]
MATITNEQMETGDGTDVNDELHQQEVKSAIASLTVSEPRIEPLVSKGEQERTGPTQFLDWNTVRTRLEATFNEITGNASAVRRSGNVIQDDSALLEILGDDHLTGRAKSIYLTLPSGVKERGFEAVIEKMNKLLAKDSTAARIRALAEMKKLKIRSDQSVADFCLVIEKLGSIANPQSSPEERSIEYAQILLSNLEDWPEYVYLMSAVHKAAPVTAYDEIKQLAISIEQTRVMARTEKSKSVTQRFRWKEVSGTKESTEDWRSRYKQYYHGRTEDHRATECEKPRRSTENKDPTARNFIEEDHRITSNETRKCYNCAKFGHIGRNCPLRHGQVNQVKGRRILEEGTPENGSISKIIEKAYSRGMRASHNELEQSEMIGKRFLTSIEILGNETEALIDTGSMVSILSIGILRSAQQRGIDVDALETIGSDSMKPVYDASNNKMKFLGAVYVDVAIKGGRKSRVPFHISQEKGCEVLLGTNALNNLGVTINISPPQSEKQHEEVKKKETNQHEEVKKKETNQHEEVKKKETNKVRVIKRTYIPPQSSALVTVHCNTSEEDTDYVLWATKEGVASGVYSIRNQQTTVPINNTTSSPLMLKEGEEVAYWGTEKLRENWRELTPTMMDTEDFEPDSTNRRFILHNQIAKNTKDGKIHPLIQEVLDEYSEAFSVCDKELTRTKLAEMTIDTGENGPIKLKTRPVPLAVRPKLREMLEDLEKRAIIEKSKSPWAFPIVLVEKKDGSLRLCVDYRELNKRIVQDSYPLPTMDALLQSLSGKRFFSTLDLCSGYWQIPVAQKDKEKTAFTTPVGLFHFCVTPFGLSTSPPVFQRMMDTLLHGLIGEEIFCYIDDIIVCTETEERHVELLKEICTRMIDANLRLKAQKCYIMQTEVSFLGHIIDEQGVHMDPEKVRAIEMYPTPKNVKELKTFLGMAAFYRKFCLGFSKISGCLYSLTSPKAKWLWESQQQAAFENLKKMITTAPVLTQPDIEKARTGSRPFVIFTDASTYGIGAVLSQEDDDGLLHPVYFASKSLSKSERRYHVTDLEALALVFAVRRFHMFIYGVKTVVKTDHQPLTALFKRSNVSARVLRWALELQRYHLEIQFVKGRANAVADALSRGLPKGLEDAPSSMEGLNDAVVNTMEVKEKSKWFKELETDPQLGAVIRHIEKGGNEGTISFAGMKHPIRMEDFVVDEGELKMYTEDGSLVLVVPKSARFEIFHEAHSGTFAGHFSTHKLYNLLRKRVFWPGMIQDVRKWTKECQKCFIYNANQAIVPPLKPIITTNPYELVGVDILELGITSKGNRYAVTIIDHFSKYGAAYPVPDKTAETVANTLFLRWIAEGCRWPKAIMSDKGGEFENKVMQEITKITGIQHVTTKGYNPRENGITERLNGTIVAMLRKSTPVATEWDTRLPYCMMAYNITPHAATGESPYFLLHGRDPVFPSAIAPTNGISWYKMHETLDHYKTEILQAITETQERVRDYNERVRESMKKVYDERNKVHKLRNPKVGDRVYVRSPAEKSKSTHPKFVCEWAGPFRVLQTSPNSALVTRIGENAEPQRIQLDMLRVVPNYISDERVDTVTQRGRRGRKPKEKTCVLLTSCFRGITLESPEQVGHVEYQCADECFHGVTLGDIEGINFIGACAKTPFKSVWAAWKAASIFIRRDIDDASKIKYFRKGTVSLDETALKYVLKVAYERCVDWTEFITSTPRIQKHQRVEETAFVGMYDEALRDLKQEMEKEDRRNRPQKKGPIGYATIASGRVLEKDNIRVDKNDNDNSGTIITKAIVTFEEMEHTLCEWRTFGTWVLVWPIDKHPLENTIENILRCIIDHMKAGGKVVTAWTPIVENNCVDWYAMRDLWVFMDDTLKKCAGVGQMFTTARNHVKQGRVFLETGAPEGSAQYYGTYKGVGLAKYLYVAIKRTATGAILPSFPDDRFKRPPRTAATRGSGMSDQDDQILTKKRPQSIISTSGGGKIQDKRAKSPWSPRRARPSPGIADCLLVSNPLPVVYSVSNKLLLICESYNSSLNFSFKLYLTYKLQDNLLNNFIKGDRWCPIFLFGVKCPHSTWYFSYYCCGEAMSKCCMNLTVLGYFGMFIAIVLMIMTVYIYRKHGRICSFFCSGHC